MATCIVMPKAGVSVETCIMGKWAKKVGETIQTGELMFEYETDKASFEYRAEQDGFILAELVEEGDDVPVLQPVAYIGAKGEAVPESAAPVAHAVQTAEEPREKAETKECAAPSLPETVQVIVMPKAGVSVETCIMGKWHKKNGDSVAAGELVFEYETDKASFEYRAEAEGVLLKTLVEEGDDVPVLQPVCYLGKGDEDVSSLEAAQTAAPAAEKKETAPVQAVEAVPAAQKSGTELRISPRARKLAQSMDIRDLSVLSGTGPNGRIIERDVRVYEKARAIAPVAAVQQIAEKAPVVTAAAVEAEYEDKKLTNIRKVIAHNMHASLSEMAQLTHFMAFDATEMLEYRAKLKENREKLNLPGITINDLVLYGVSRVLLKYPDLNAHFMGDAIRYFKHVHLGMAVDTPRGLMVPTIFNADTKSLAEISKEAKELAAACQSGAIVPEKLSGASFTVSNVGASGTEMFTPVINPPQTGILGVGAIVDRARKNGDQIELYPALGLSLTYDHRALDGAPAARFLQEVAKSMEEFTLLLAK